MEALVHSAPGALRHERGKQSAAAKFPEFRAWHALMEPLFGFTPPDWTIKPPAQGLLFKEMSDEYEGEEEEIDEEGENGD